MYEDLDKLINNIKNHRIWYVCLIILLGIAIPLFIQIPYWIGHYTVLINTDFKASDILSFSGSFLAFSATTTLGVLALWQNKVIQQKASDENKEIKKQNEILRKQDLERRKMECMYKYYSNVMLCDDFQIRTNITQMLTEDIRENYKEQVLYKKDDFNGTGFYAIEVKFILKLLNQYFPQSIRINFIALHYNGCYRRYESNVISDGDSINLFPRKDYFSLLSVKEEEKLKLSATLCINKIPNENDARDYINAQSESIVRKIRESKQIFMVINLTVKNSFNITTTALYIIELKCTNEIDDNKFLKFKIEDITMQLAGLDMVE